jgi:hypothetical protein
LFDVTRGTSEINFPSTHSHHALTRRDYKSFVVTFRADVDRE